MEHAEPLVVALQRLPDDPLGRLSRSLATAVSRDHCQARWSKAIWLDALRSVTNAEVARRSGQSILYDMQRLDTAARHLSGRDLAGVIFEVERVLADPEHGGGDPLFQFNQALAGELRSLLPLRHARLS